MKKRFLSFILAILMVLSGVTPALNVSASEIDSSEVIAEEISVEELPIEELSAEEELPSEELTTDEQEVLTEEVPAEQPVEEELSEEELLPEEEIQLMEVVSAYPITIDDGEGQEVISTSKQDVEGGWSFDAETMTLTLNSFDGKSIYAAGDLNLVLENTNTITVSANVGYALRCAGTLTIKANSDSATDILNISMTEDPTVSTYFIQNEKTMTMNGGTVSIIAGTALSPLNTSSTIYGVCNNIYLNEDAILNYTIVNQSTSGMVQGVHGTVYMRSRANCSFAIVSNNGNSFNVNDLFMKGQGNLTLSANKTDGGLQVPNINVNSGGNFNLEDGATGSVIVEGCLEKVSYYESAYIHYKAMKGDESVGFIWSARVAPPGYTSGYKRYQIAGADGKPLEDFTLEYVETQPFTVTDSPIYDHLDGKVGDNYSYNDLDAYPKLGVHGGSGRYGMVLADDSAPLPAGLSLNNGGYLTGTPTEAHAAGSYKIKATSGGEIQYITVNYGKIEDRDYFVTVGGQQINTNADNSGAGWSYDTETNTLTLNGYNGAPIYAEKDLNLVLQNTNTITVPAATGYGIKCDGTLTIEKAADSATDILNISMTEDPTVSTCFVQNKKTMTMNGGTVSIIAGTALSPLDTSSTIYGVLNNIYLNEDASLNYTIVNQSKSGMVQGVHGTVYMRSRANCSFAIVSNNGNSSNVNDLFMKGQGNLTLSANKTDGGLQVPNINVNSGGGNFNLEDGATGSVIVEGCLEKVSYYESAYIHYKAMKGDDSVGFIWSARVAPPGYTSGYKRYQIAGADGKPLEDFTLEYVETQPFTVTDSPIYDHLDGKVGDNYSYNDLDAYPKLGVHGGSGRYGMVLADDSAPLPAGLSLNNGGYLTGTPTEAHAAGSYKIKATSGGETQYITVNYGEITWNTYVTSLTLDKEEVILDPSGSFELTATILPEEADSCDVNWSTAPTNWLYEADRETPAVNQRKVTFKHNGAYFGKVTVTATSKVSGLIKSCDVYIKERTPEARINRDLGCLVDLLEGRDYRINGVTYTASLIPESHYVGVPLRPEWDGQNLEIVLLNAEEKCNSAPQTLAFTNISLDKSEVVLNQGESTQLTATVLPADIANADVEWICLTGGVSMRELANPDANKRAVEFTAQNIPGKHTLTARTDSAKVTAVCSVYIKEAVPTAVYDEITGVVSGLVSGKTYLVNGEEMVAGAVDGGYGFIAKPEWKDTVIQIVRANTEAKCNSNPQALAISEFSLDLSEGIDIILSQEYVLLHGDDVFDLTAQVDPEILTNYVEWSSSDNAIASVDDYGSVTATGAGTAFIKAVVEVNGVRAEATCRIDVIEGTIEDALIENGTVHLAANSVTSYLYSTNYAGVEVYLDLKQNMVLKAVRAIPEDKGEMIANPTFVDAKLDEYFALRMADDRTMLVIPKVDTSNAAAVKALKSSYKSQIRFEVDGCEVVAPETLTIKVDKKMPSVKASSIKLESFYRGLEAPLVFTSKSGEVVAIDATDIPYWLTVNEEEMTVSVKDGYLGGKYSGKLGLKATVEGFAPVSVTVSVSAAAKAPKLKLSSTSITMAQSGGTLGAEVTLISGDSKVLFDDMNVTDIQVVDYNTLNAKDQKTYAVNANYKVLEDSYNAETGSFRIAATGTPKAGKVQLAAVIGGDAEQLVKIPLTIKIHTKAATIKLSKTSATLNMDFGAGKDPYVVKVNATPADYDLTDALTIKVMDKSGKTEVPTELDVIQAGNKITVNSNANTKYGTTYKVTVILKNVEKAKAATLTVKTTALNKGKATLSLSAKGSFDTARIYSGSVVVTPKYKNFNGFGEAENTLTVKAVDSKTKVSYDHTGRFTITENANGSYTLRVAEGQYLDASLKYSVTMESLIGDVPVRTAKGTNLTVKQGSIKVDQDTKTINLYKNDRYSEGYITLSIADATVVPVAQVTLKDSAQSLFEVEDLGNGKYAIGYKDDQIAPKVKNGSVKLEVKLAGNNTAKANATVSVSVKVVEFKNK